MPQKSEKNVEEDKAHFSGTFSLFSGRNPCAHPQKNTSNTKKWNQVMSNQLENIILQCTNFLRFFSCKIQANINIFLGLLSGGRLDVNLLNAAISNKTKWPYHLPRTSFFKSFRFFPMYWSSIIGKCFVPCEFQYFWKSEPP